MDVEDGEEKEENRQFLSIRFWDRLSRRKREIQDTMAASFEEKYNDLKIEGKREKTIEAHYIVGCGKNDFVS